MSTMRCCSAWKVPIGTPNCFLVFRYSSVVSQENFIAPTASAQARTVAARPSAAVIVWSGVSTSQLALPKDTRATGRVGSMLGRASIATVRRSTGTNSVPRSSRTRSASA